MSGWIVVLKSVSTIVLFVFVLFGAFHIDEYFRNRRARRRRIRLYRELDDQLRDRSQEEWLP